MYGTDWGEVLVGPVVVLLLGWVLAQFRVLRKENTNQHAAGRELVQSVTDSVHNLTGKVDGVVEKVDRITERLEDHIAASAEPRTPRKRKDAA